MDNNINTFSEYVLKNHRPAARHLHPLHYQTYSAVDLGFIHFGSNISVARLYLFEIKNDVIISIWLYFDRDLQKWLKIRRQSCTLYIAEVFPLGGHVMYV